MQSSRIHMTKSLRRGRRGQQKGLRSKNDVSPLSQSSSSCFSHPRRILYARASHSRWAMNNIVESDVRSRIMSRIRGANTRPEMLVRRALHRRGLRYRLHRRDLPGRPDMVFAGSRAVLFIHGCFWHRHLGCAKATTPVNNAEFWHDKFNANVARDRRQIEALIEAGWRVRVVWECEIGRTPDPLLIDELEAFIRVGAAQGRRRPRP